MTYSFEGFSTPKMMELGMDITDATVLRWFVEFINFGKMKKITKNEKDYYWVKYEYVIGELPYLGITNTRVIARRFERLVKLGVLDKELYQGRYSYFAVNSEVFESLVTAPVLKSTSTCTQKYTSPVLKSTPIDSNIIDSNISNSNNILPVPIPENQNQLYGIIKAIFEKVNGNFTNYAKEGAAIKRIIKLTNGDREAIEMMIKTFFTLRQSASSFWSGQPFTPSALAASGIWDRVKEEAKKQIAEQSEDETFARFEAEDRAREAREMEGVL